ncbi:MAG: hypothetical protein B7733_21040 [Myxococcales bacterium FL481]|nr:MAG: hypothetical protein B7733_21040 [Myxococcales bacterium FL481]
MEERQRRNDSPSPTVGPRHSAGPVAFSFDYLQIVPVDFAGAQSAPGVTPETSTIFDFVANAHWDGYGLWIAERGGRPTVTLDSLARPDGSTIPLTGQCGSLGANQPAEPGKVLEPTHDTIHACAAIKTDGEPIVSIRGHMDLEFAPQRVGYRLDVPTAGDRVEGPEATFVVEEILERKVKFRLEGEPKNFWNVVGLDDDGHGVRMTMVSTFDAGTTVTWASMPAALRIEFAAAPAASVPPGATCGAGARCTRRETFDIPLSGLSRPVTADDPKSPAVAGTTLRSASDDWYTSYEPQVAATRAIASARVDEGLIVLRAIQAANWLAPLFELWTPLQPGIHTSFGQVSWHVSKIELDGTSRRSPARGWTAGGYLAPFLHDAGFSAGVGRVDVGEVASFVSKGGESATIKAIEGDLTTRSLVGEPTTQALPLAQLGVWSDGKPVAGRWIRVSTRDAQIEVRGDLDRVAGVVLRDQQGAVIEAPRIFRGGGCMMPVAEGGTMHMCFATPRRAAASVELVTGQYAAGKKQTFRLELE